MNKLKDRIAWFKSFFTSAPVLTGQGFTTDDKGLGDLQKKEFRRPGMARYVSKVEHSFILVGQELVNGQVVYRLYDDTFEKEYTLSKELFDFLFRLQKEV